MSTSYTYNDLSVEQRGKLFIIKFNRPARKNAIRRLTFRELMRALGSVAYDDSVTTVALTGVGDFFSSGNDLKDTLEFRSTIGFSKSANYYLRNLIKTVINCRKVLVAVVNGPSIGIAFTLCGLCDIVYCTENAYFESPFAKLGLCPESASSYLLPRILGQAKAAEMLYFGAKLSAKQALQFGFVADVLRIEDLDTKLWPQLVKNADLPACSLCATKRLMLPWEERQKILAVTYAECDELERLRNGEANLKALQMFSSRKESKL